MKKICVVTATRAEYGSLYWIMKEIENDDALELQLIVTGTHLSPEFGLTYKEIEKDFKIDKKIEILLSSDSAIGLSKAMGLVQISFAEAYSELNPDIVIILGDRYEMLSAASCAMILGIPIMHLAGGERTEGAFDESIRHAITKLSHIHCATTEEYKNRIIQLGENPANVFNVGGFGIDNILRLKLLSKKEFEESINFTLNKKNILLTFHPVTLEKFSAKEQFQAILDAIDELENTNIIMTKANSDTNGRVINAMCEEYASKNPHKAVVFASLGQLRYISALRHVDAVVGNSSSGLAEVPSFKIGTINIGTRQQGRLQAKSVINCEPMKESILKAFKKLYSHDFQESLKNVENPYGSEMASKKVVTILKNSNLQNIIIKNFYDIKL
ncbi:MAG: UDP-N-acetylglucosamine 2-epimerase [Sulfurimonas sp.]|jgi:GDP/UDP-N,N'-diacetylbacillosamine 2-epimerase (hydrolysing)